jgi:hypothetical protein
MDFMLTDAQKKKIEDIALGKSVTQRKSIDDQIAALRKQIVLLSEKAKVELVPGLRELEDIVAEEKEKKPGKS